MAGKGFSVFVTIGGKVSPSLTSAISQTESRFAGLAKSAVRYSRNVKAAVGELATASKGLAGIAAAGGLAVGLKHAISGGANLAHETQALRNAGRTVVEMSEALAQANKTMRELPTSTLSDNLAVIKETTGAFGDFHHALENLTFNQKLGAVLKNTIGEKAGLESGDMFNKLVRAFEIRGTANDAKTYQREAGELARAMVFTGGKVNADEFLNFAQQANPAIKNLSERFLTKIAPSLIQELGGDRAGTALSAFRSTVMGKVRDKKQTAEWIRLGLLDKDQVLGGKDGPIGFKAGAVKGTNLAISDPLKWAEEVLIPALKEKGVNVDDQLELSKQLATMFRNQNANRFAEAITQSRDRARLHKDEGLINKVHPVDQAYEENLKNDPKVGLQALKSSVENFGEALMSPAVTAITPTLTAIARGINAIAGAMQENPGLAAGLSAVALAFGAFAALKLLELAAGVSALAKAIVGLSAAEAAAKTGASAAAGAAGGFVGAAANENGGALAGAAAGSMIGAASTVAGVAVGGAALATAATNIAQGIVENAPELAKSVVENSMLSAMSGDLGLGLAITQATRDAGTKAGEGLKSGVEGVDYSGAGAKAGQDTTGGFAGADFAGAGTKAGQTLSSSFWNAIKSATEFATGQRSAPASPGVAGARARGGPVTHGLPYLVGEKGPEIFVPNSHGKIETNATLNRLTGSKIVPDAPPLPKANKPVGAPAASRFAGTGDRTLDAIIRAEGTAKGGRDPFNTTLGYGRYGTPDKPLTDMTLREAYAFGRQVRHRHGRSSALGAFQIVGRTMKSFMGQAGLSWGDKFSPDNQMALARAIRAKQGLGAWEGFKHNRAALADARKGGPAEAVGGDESAPAKVAKGGESAPERVAKGGEASPARVARGNAATAAGEALNRPAASGGEGSPSRVAMRSKAAIARLAAHGRLGEESDAPRFHPDKIASAKTEKPRIDAKTGDLHVTVNVDAKGLDADEVAREVERKVTALLRKYQAEQRGSLSD